MNNGYDVFAESYDALMAEVDYQSLADYYNSMLGSPSGILLDLACGTGRLSAIMAGKGWSVIGVDNSVEMLSRARQHKEITYICQDITELDLYGTVNAAICSLDGLNHLYDEAQLRKALERVSLFMEPGGLFAFDMNTVYKHETILDNHIFVKEADQIYCVWRNFYQGKGVVDITLDIFTECEDCSYNRSFVQIREKAYDLDIIRGLCEQSGFEIMGLYDSITTNPVNANSERVIFVCKKISPV